MPSVGFDEDAEGFESTLSERALAGGDACRALDGRTKIFVVEENGETLADSTVEIGKISLSPSEPAEEKGRMWGKVKSHPR